MPIDRVELYTISMPLVTPFVTSYGSTTNREAIVIALHGDGLTGWGEVVADPVPWYTGETLAGALLVLRDYLAPSVIGQRVEDIEDFLRLTSWVKGNQMAHAGLEMAWWDLKGQASGRSLATMLGGYRERVPVGVAVGIQPDRDSLLRVVGGYLREGYNRVKIKVKPDWLVEPVRALREEFGAAPMLQVDANSAFTLDDAPLLATLNAYNLLLIEQPLADDDFVEHAALQKLIRTPVCLDESINSVAAARVALALQAAQIINIKAGRVGGLSQAREIHDLCVAAGVPVWCGGMLETGIGRASNLALATLPGFTLPGDISATARYYSCDIIEEVFTLNGADSTITVPGGPGLGVHVDEAQLARVTLHRERVKRGRGIGSRGQ